MPLLSLPPSPLLLLLALLSHGPPALALDNGLALTPPMGWRCAQRLFCCQCHTLASHRPQLNDTAVSGEHHRWSVSLTL